MVIELIALFCAAAYDIAYCVVAWKAKKRPSAFYGMLLMLLCAAGVVMLFVI